jgi:hypothetical protein
MKKTFIIINLFLALVFLTNCVEYADEDIVVNGAESGLSLYKTKKDYYNYITIRLDSNDVITMSPSYNIDDPRISYKNGKVEYKLHWRLKNDYILSEEMQSDLVFTDITFQELVEYIEKNGGNIPIEWFTERIIDKNPFLEFYYLKNELRSKNFTIKEINEMIENKTIEDYFNKTK